MIWLETEEMADYKVCKKVLCSVSPTFISLMGAAAAQVLPAGFRRSKRMVCTVSKPEIMFTISTFFMDDLGLQKGKLSPLWL